jgi:hypothetical protein
MPDVEYVLHNDVVLTTKYMSQLLIWLAGTVK